MNFKVVYLKENQGHGKARQKAIELCSNEIVALMDADDISTPSRFQIQMKELLLNKGIDIIGGQIAEFSDEVGDISSIRTVELDDCRIKKDMKKRCPMNQMTVMFRKNAVLDAGGYLDWYCDEDYYLWIRMALKEKVFKNVEDVLVHVRIGNGMSARRGGLKYFKSEIKLQYYMLKKKYISFLRFFYNTIKRFVGEVILTDELRCIAYRYMRKQSKTYQNKSNICIDKTIVQYLPFSVAMCVYEKDNPQWFETALRSIINQSLEPDEIVLVVDGPISPELECVVNKYFK